MLTNAPCRSAREDGPQSLTERFVRLPGAALINELNQAVQIVRAADPNVFSPEPVEPLLLTNVLYLKRIFCDANYNIALHQIEDRGNTSGVGANNYDPNRNQVLAAVYDERDLPFQETR